jgi:hypothetical protein
MLSDHAEGIALWLKHGAVRHLEQSCDEVAEKVHVSPSAVSKAISRGQNTLSETEFEKLLICIR